MRQEPILEVLSRAGPEGTRVVDVAGEIDLDSCALLHEELTRLLEEGHTRLAVDLARVSYLDSTGLRVLLQAQAGACARGGGLVLVAAGARVEKILRMVGLEALLPRAGTVAEAVPLLTRRR